MKNYYIFAVKPVGNPTRPSIVSDLHKIHLTRDAYFFVRAQKIEADAMDAILVSLETSADYTPEIINNYLWGMNKQEYNRFIYENRV